MTDLIQSLLKVMLRLVLLAAGLVFFASMLFAAAVLLMLWLTRALWAKLTGRPVAPWVFKMGRQPPWQRDGFPGRRQAPAADNVVDADVREVSARPQSSDVTDVEPKRIGPL